MSLLLDALFNSVAYGHFIVDLVNGQRSVLLTYWSDQIGMNNATLALVTTIYVWVASLSQPIFGWVADRFGKSRLLAGGGILWMAGFFSLALTLPVEWAIPCIILASLGSAAFHPVGATQASLRGRSLLAGRDTTSTSWFFVFGQAGSFLGPIVGGPLLQYLGPMGLMVMAAPMLVIGANAVWRLKTPAILPKQETDEEATKGTGVKAGIWFLLALVVVASFQSCAQQNIVTFLPRHLSSLGQQPSIYGLVTGLLMGGSALGLVLGGNLADKFGRRKVAVAALALASLPIMVISQVGWTPWLYLLVPLAGLLTGAVHSIIVVLAQRVVRGSMTLASGLIMGFMFSAGALGTLLTGSLADAWGFPKVFLMTAGLVLAASLAALGLGEKRSQA
jgi:MFS transporter, FSR family, fosmidomycin resistance protein